MQVRNRITGQTFTAPSRYWVQGRYVGSDEFCVVSKFRSIVDARTAGQAAMAEGAYDEVIVQNIDSGKRVAEFR